MNLYDLLRIIGINRRKIVKDTLADIERDEAAAKQRTIDAVKLLRDESGRN